MMEGKNEELSTSELFGGARNHHIFQDIFVKSLEEVDPCEDLTDDDIRTAIQNAMGPKSTLFVPEVPFEVLIRRHIAHGLHKYTSCGNKAHEMALQQVKSSRIAAPNLRQKLHATFAISQTFANGLANYIILMLIFCLHIATGWSRSRKVPTSERSLKSHAILARSVRGFIPDQVVRLAPVVEKTIASGVFPSDNRPSIEDNFISKQFSDPVQSMDHAFSMIHYRETVVIAITKLLLRSYCDIVRKKNEDLIPKAIMHFLIYTMWFIKKLYRYW
ncbi:hypothetical protein R3W88_003701 [Solanum pinnatisectum]|uniref:GED domain-containing protein n=1 Tax=Solanum pinnatisectum TaxID=50273 RepID=A0AAV9MPU4_9SOLN|nr:hypothetical protein R3W88_003701 [Solanum pinnatisectum]